MSMYSKTKTAHPREMPFDIDYTSLMDGSRYTGRFVARRPNVWQQMEIEGLKSKQLGGHYYDDENPGCGIPPHMEMMAETTAFLRIVLIESPEWWKAEDVYDPGLVAAIYEEAVKVDPFRFQRGTDTGFESVGTTGERGDQERQRSDAEGRLEAMVDAKVPTPDNEQRVG